MAKTSNVDWYLSKNAVGLIAVPPRSKRTEELLTLVNRTHITQGPEAGKTFGECILPWQERIVRWIPHVDEIGMKVGKGSGKSMLTAAIALGMAKLWNNENSHPRGLIVVLAANVESARIVFGHIWEAILFDDKEKAQWTSNVQSRSLTHDVTKVKIQIIPPKMNRAVGLRPSLLVIDELHEASLVQNFDDVLRQLQHGGRNWEDFKQITITTAPTSYGVGYYTDWLARLRAVRDGKIENSRILPALFEFPVLQRPDLDIEDPKHWFFGMPSLIPRKGARGTMHWTALKKELEEAVADVEVVGIGNFQSLLSQRLGIEAEERQGGGLTNIADVWDKAAIDDLPGKPERLVIAMDPSAGAEDPFGLVCLYIFGEVWVAASKQWLTHRAFDKAPSRIKKIYEDAIDAEELTLLETDREIEADVHSFCKGWEPPPDFGGDAAGLAGFAERFRQSVGNYEPVKQGWQIMASFRAAEGAILAGRLKHLGQPLLGWNIKNLRIFGNQLKKADDRGSGMGLDKIDGAMALLSAIHINESTPQIDPGALIG